MLYRARAQTALLGFAWRRTERRKTKDEGIRHWSFVPCLWSSGKTHFVAVGSITLPNPRGTSIDYERAWIVAASLGANPANQTTDVKSSSNWSTVPPSACSSQGTGWRGSNARVPSAAIRSSRCGDSHGRAKSVAPHQGLRRRWGHRHHPWPIWASARSDALGNSWNEMPYATRVGQFNFTNQWTVTKRRIIWHTFRNRVEWHWPHSGGGIQRWLISLSPMNKKHSRNLHAILPKTRLPQLPQNLTGPVLFRTISSNKPTNLVF